jgi:hypothetical protein
MTKKSNKDKKHGVVMIIATGEKPKKIKKADEPPRKSKRAMRRERYAARTAKRAANQTTRNEKLLQMMRENPNHLQHIIETRKISPDELAQKVGVSREDLLAGKGLEGKKLAESIDEVAEGASNKRQSDVLRNKIISQQRSEKKGARKKFDLSQFDKLVGRFSLDGRDKSGVIDEGAKRKLAQKLGIAPGLIRNDNPQLEQLDVFSAMKQLGGELAAERKEAREARAKGQKPTQEGRPQEPSGDRIEDWMFPGHKNEGEEEEDDGDKDSWDDEDSWGEHGTTHIEGDERDRQARRVQLGRSHQHHPHANEYVKPNHKLYREPSTVNTTPFPQSMGRGQLNRPRDKTVEGDLHGFAPLPSPNFNRLSSPQEEEAEEDLPEYPQFTRGTPMDIAFQLLKASCKCCNAKPCTCKKNCKCRKGKGC